MTQVNCRFCGRSPRDVMTPVPSVDPPSILAHADIEPCGYNPHHVFVHKEHPAYKEHPMTQYASELDARVRACPDCSELTRYGATFGGRWEWFSRDTLRQHWRECKGGQHEAGKGSVLAVLQTVPELRGREGEGKDGTRTAVQHSTDGARVQDDDGGSGGVGDDSGGHHGPDQEQQSLFGAARGDTAPTLRLPVDAQGDRLPDGQGPQHDNPQSQGRVITLNQQFGATKQ